MQSIFRGGVLRCTAIPLPEICLAALGKLSTLPQGEGGFCAAISTAKKQKGRSNSLRPFADSIRRRFSAR